MVQRSEDMGDGEERKGSAVPDGHILGSDLRIFQNVAVRDPRHNSDHLMVIGCLNGTYPREKLRNLGRRMRLPLRPPGHQTRMRADKIFSKLRHVVPKPDKWAVRHNLWISADTWRFIDERVSARQ